MNTHSCEIRCSHRVIFTILNVWDGNKDCIIINNNIKAGGRVKGERKSSAVDGSHCKYDFT